MAEPPAEREISRFPCKKRQHMPGSLTTPGCPSTRVDVLDHVAFRYLYSVGTQDIPIAAQWLACALPYRHVVSQSRVHCRAHLDKPVSVQQRTLDLARPLF